MSEWFKFLSNNIPSELIAALEFERASYNILPAQDKIFNAFRYTPFEKVKVVILGQDPYHTPGVAHGLAFSTRGQVIPPSLRNIFKELKDDLDIDPPSLGGSLKPWAQKGVLLLNTSLTVRAGEPGSHTKIGWRPVIIKAIQELMYRRSHIHFILWGGHAKALFIESYEQITTSINGTFTVTVSPHPSPFSADKGFFGSKPFSKSNDALIKYGSEPIDWSLTN